MMQGSRREGRDEGQPQGSKPGEPLSIVLIIINDHHYHYSPSFLFFPMPAASQEQWESLRDGRGHLRPEGVIKSPPRKEWSEAARICFSAGDPEG